ncbi:TRAP transporter substrate-binding protein [Xanthobacter sp. ZOL 2024]
MNRRNFLVSAGAILVASATGGAALAQKPIVMKLGTATINDSQHAWMKRFAELVAEKSGQRISVEVYPASQLGASPRMIEQTQMNTIQGVVTPPEFLGGIDSRFQVLSAPGIFTDLAHTNRTLQDPEFNKAFLSLGQDRGLLGLGLFISGPSIFASTKPIKALDDFGGKKIRVLPAQLQLEQIRALGATPIPMPPSEVLPALQQGTLDAVMSCLPVLAGLRYNDAAKYLSETNHGVISSIAVISKDWYDGLPPDLQKVIVEAGKQATTDVYEFSVKDVDDARELWVAGGGEIVPITPEFRAQVAAKLAPLAREQLKSRPQDLALYELLVRATERTKR